MYNLRKRRRSYSPYIGPYIDDPDTVRTGLRYDQVRGSQGGYGPLRESHIPYLRAALRIGYAGATYATGRYFYNKFRRISAGPDATKTPGIDNEKRNKVHSANMPFSRRRFGRFKRKRRFRKSFRRRGRFKRKLMKRFQKKVLDVFSPPVTYIVTAGQHVGFGNAGTQGLYWGGVANDYFINASLSQSSVVTAAGTRYLDASQNDIMFWFTKRKLTSKILNNKDLRCFVRPVYFAMRNDIRDTDYPSFFTTPANAWDSSNVVMRYIYNALVADVAAAQVANFTSTAGTTNFAYASITGPQGSRLINKAGTGRTIGFKFGKTRMLEPGGSLTKSMRAHKAIRFYPQDFYSRLQTDSSNQNTQAQVSRKMTFGILWLVWGDLVYDSLATTEVNTGQFDALIEWKSQTTVKRLLAMASSHYQNDLRGSIPQANQIGRVDIDMDAVNPA